MMKVGICDWGIGGAGIYRLLRERSTVDMVYLSDTGYTPYGKVPEQELKERLQHVFGFLRSRGCEKIIVGCNAASTVLDANKNIAGVIEHGVNLVLKSNVQEVAVVGGKRTIESGMYKNRLEEKGIKVFQRVAQPLSARIETGDIDSESLKKDIGEIFGPVSSVEHILLACTHYPLIRKQISNFTGNTKFLDPAVEMTDWILENWELPAGKNTIEWLTTGDPVQMRKSLALLYNINPSDIKNISIL